MKKKASLKLLRSNSEIVSKNDCDICLRPNQMLYYIQTQGGGTVQMICRTCMQKYKEMYLRNPVNKGGKIPFMVTCPLSQKPQTILALACSKEEMILLPCCGVFAFVKPQKICHLCLRVLCTRCTQNCFICGLSTCPRCFREVFPNHKCKGCLFLLPPIAEEGENPFIQVSYLSLSYIYIFRHQRQIRVN